MLLNSVKFYNRILLNQIIVRHISYTWSKSNTPFVNFLQNENRNVMKTQDSNQKPPKLIFSRKYFTDHMAFYRTFSTRSLHIIGKPKNMGTKEENEEFMSLFPVIVSDLTKSIQRVGITELCNHLETLLQYTIITGKQLRGLGLVVAYKMIESPENLNSENIRLANILGWCAEISQASSLILDDIIDQSEMRRKTKDVGLGINDGFMLKNSSYLILKKYFANHPNYLKMMELFSDVQLKGIIGQRLDFLYMAESKPNFKYFTIETFKKIAKYKTTHSFAYFSVALAMHLAKKQDEDLLRQANGIFLEIGELHQIQNDFLDCFGNSENTGKEGNDICEGKCTWLAVVALQKASPKQIQIFKEHYGKGSNRESAQIVRNLYEELGLPQIYANYEKDTMNFIHSLIQQSSKELPQALYFKFLSYQKVVNLKLVHDPLHWKSLFCLRKSGNQKMGITIYHFPPSAPSRIAVVVARALGLDVDIQIVDLFAKEQFGQDFVKVNPQHCVPTLVDGDFVLWESRAIAIYLLETYGKDSSLYPKDVKKKALINQRLYFDCGTLYPRIRAVCFPILFLGEIEILHEVKLPLEEALGFLDVFLEGNNFTCGDQLTVADISLSASISTIAAVGWDLTPYANVSAWISRCALEIPGYAELNQKGAEAFGKAVRKKLAPGQL